MNARRTSCQRYQSSLKPPVEKAVDGQHAEHSGAIATWLTNCWETKKKETNHDSPLRRDLDCASWLLLRGRRSLLIPLERTCCMCTHCSKWWDWSVFLTPTAVGSILLMSHSHWCAVVWQCHSIRPTSCLPARETAVAKRTPRHWSWAESSLQERGFAELLSLGVLVKVASEWRPSFLGTQAANQQQQIGTNWTTGSAFVVDVDVQDRKVLAATVNRPPESVVHDYALKSPFGTFSCRYHVRIRHDVTLWRVFAEQERAVMNDDHVEPVMESRVVWQNRHLLEDRWYVKVHRCGWRQHCDRHRAEDTDSTSKLGGDMSCVLHEWPQLMGPARPLLNLSERAGMWSSCQDPHLGWGASSARFPCRSPNGTCTRPHNHRHGDEMIQKFRCLNLKSNHIKNILKKRNAI